MLGDTDTYLINPYGLLFDEITVSNLVLVDFAGDSVHGTSAYNAAGHVLHSAVLRTRPEINYVLHSHTPAGAAVSAMRCGLLPISQPALVVRSTLAQHSYGVVEHKEDGEGDRVATDLGANYAMLMQSHGVLVCGRTAAEAFLYHYFLQRACEIQVNVLNATDDCISAPQSAIDALATWGAPRPEPWGETQWRAVLRLLERIDPSFKE